MDPTCCRPLLPVLLDLDFRILKLGIFTHSSPRGPLLALHPEILFGVRWKVHTSAKKSERQHLWSFWNMQTCPSLVLTPPYWAGQEHLAVWESCQTAESGRMKWWDRGRRDGNNKGGGGGPFFVIFAHFHLSPSHYLILTYHFLSRPGRLSHISSAFTPLLLLSPFACSSADS